MKNILTLILLTLLFIGCAKKEVQPVKNSVGVLMTFSGYQPSDTIFVTVNEVRSFTSMNNNATYNLRTGDVVKVLYNPRITQVPPASSNNLKILFDGEVKQTFNCNCSTDWNTTIE